MIFNLFDRLARKKGEGQGGGEEVRVLCKEKLRKNNCVANVGRVWVSEREKRERERERERKCVCEQKREMERDTILCVVAWVCMWKKVLERERERVLKNNGVVKWLLTLAWRRRRIKKQFTTLTEVLNIL